ncbi:MAG: aminomethyl-transferring glycine dehydrogenase subunit GcvPA [Armatimonadota bacterium]|nr:aminomethyl-transferring glycine dehydrogenase subunit GcvPA [Armatimonadota bacterium]
MPYIPHTEEDTRAMLQAIGAESIEDFFVEIPESLRLHDELDIPCALDEYAIGKALAQIGAKNRSLDKLTSFLGAGIYEHYSPSIVMELISRGEFLSAYTPYQPEVSQGSLQTIYEFQSMICAITGMEVCNASMYDGATSLAEACIMAVGVTGRDRILISDSVHPHYRDCVRTFAAAIGCEVQEAPESFLKERGDKDVACVVFQYPDFFGRLHDPRDTIREAHAHGALAIAVCEPIALGAIEPPGAMECDVVVGEAQPMGVPMGFGGPMVGYFCVKRSLVRAIPGRIVGRTHDKDGRRGFVMTLRTREQDIRREKATSNICTNQALMALCATVWMSAVGKSGFKEMAETCVRKAYYAFDKLTAIPSVKPTFPGEPFAFEFALDVGRSASEVRDALLEKDILAGLPLGDYYPAHANSLLVAVTEVRSRDEIDRFAAELRALLN